MSSSPEVSSASENGYSTPPPGGKHSDTSEATTISGFTPVNTRGSPPHAASKVNGVNGIRRQHHSPRMESTTTAQPYEGDTIRVDSGPPRTSSGDDSSTSTAGKRKRSISDGDGRNATAEQGEYAQAEKRRSPPPPQSHSWTNSPAQGVTRLPNQQPMYPVPDSQPKETHAWYGARPQSAESPNSDARLAEALQRESQNMDARHIRPNEPPLPMDHIGGTPHNQITSTTETTAAGVQVDPKKRKRVFSNRTKTGCLTCRKRKKKCDEARDECNNCKRGGFVCEGYVNKTNWTKPSIHGKVPPIAIQSRDTYSDGPVSNLMPRPPRNDYHDVPQTQTPQSAPDGNRVRPILVDEDHSRGHWSTPSWSDTPSRPYERNASNDFQPHGMPLPDLNRPQQSYDQRTAAPPHHMAVTSHGQPLTQYAPADIEALPHTISRRNDELTSAFGNRMHTSQSAVTTAQLALQTHSSSLTPFPSSSSLPGKPKTEKDKMLAGEPYLPYTSPLIDEREACKAALWRFNNSTNPSMGVSREERVRQFRAILVPASNDIRRSGNPMHPVGQLGKDVVVEAPFTCSYGYNITIGDGVVIESNCTVMDTCRVTIGNDCIIGPNVSIYSASVPVDPKLRHGSRGQQTGKMVHIADNVFIGGNVVIKPGVSIGKNSVIGAGTVVDKNVPAGVIFAGKRADTVKGLWQKEI